MRYLRYAFLLILTVLLIVIAFANRDPVTLRLLPDDLDRFWSFGRVLELPLFLVIFAAIVAGVVIGFIWEWLREHRIRADGARAAREKVRLEREIGRLKGSQPDNSGDEVLRLLDGAGGRR